LLKGYNIVTSFLISGPAESAKHWICLPRVANTRWDCYMSWPKGGIIVRPGKYRTAILQDACTKFCITSCRNLALLNLKDSHEYHLGCSSCIMAHSKTSLRCETELLVHIKSCTHKETYLKTLTSFHKFTLQPDCNREDLTLVLMIALFCLVLNKPNGKSR